MAFIESSESRGIWICSRRGVWARAIAAALNLFTNRKVAVLATLDSGKISAEVSNRSAVAQPWPEDVCILDLSLSSDDAPSRLLEIYHRLRDDAFWVGPCLVVAKTKECRKLRATAIVPSGSRFGDFPSIHRFLAEPLQLPRLMKDLTEIGEETLDLSAWRGIVDASPTLRRLSEQFSVLEATRRMGTASDMVMCQAKELSEAARDLCCEAEFWHGPVFDACCRVQAFADFESVSAEQIGQFMDDVRRVLNARWRVSDE